MEVIEGIKSHDLTPLMTAGIVMNGKKLEQVTVSNTC